jgi:hypothetical protein
LYIALKIALIDGGIPPIDSKNVKIVGFRLHKRKTSAYFPRNKPHPVINRKISAYITLAADSIVDKTSSYLKGSEPR